MNSTELACSPNVARHTRLVPSFVLPALKGPVKIEGRAFPPGELFSWTGPELSGDQRAQVMARLIQRLRRSEWLPSQEVRVRLPEGWQEQIDPADAANIKKALGKLKVHSLESVAFFAFGGAFGKGLEHQLSVLASLEALYWRPPERLKSNPRASVAPQASAPVRLEGVKALRDRVLAIPWLDMVEPTDLRFAYGSEMPLQAWLREQCTDEVSASTVALLQSLDSAHGQTAAGEIGQLAEAVGRECQPLRPAKHGAADRLNSFLAHWLYTGRKPPSDPKISLRFGMSASLVYEVRMAFCRVLRCTPVATPVLDRVMAKAAQSTPHDVAHLNRMLGPELGDEAGIECVLAWRSLLGRGDPPDPATGPSP